MSSLNSVLSFYFDMLFVNSIQHVKDSFIGNPTLQEKEYTYLQDQNYYIKEEMVEDDGTMPIFVTDIIKREEFLERLMNFENTSIYKSIEFEVSRKNTKQDKITCLKKIYDDIQVLLKRLLKIEDEEVRLIEDMLIELIKNLKDRYSAILKYHDVFKSLVNETDVTFFKNKDLKYSFYVELYEITYNLDLIDDAEIDEVDFVNAFTSPNPQLLTNKIRFIQNNSIVAYFLHNLQPFFNKFTHEAIGKSAVFINKQSKQFNEVDINTALTRGKNKYQDYKLKIDKAITNLKNKYLN